MEELIQQLLQATKTDKIDWKVVSTRYIRYMSFTCDFEDTEIKVHGGEINNIFSCSILCHEHSTGYKFVELSLDNNANDQELFNALKELYAVIFQKWMKRNTHFRNILTEKIAKLNQS